MGKKLSIPVKFFIVFSLTLLLLSGSFLASLYPLRTQVSRNEAAAVADQVISFRSWVAKSGMVWVNKLAPEFHDYLSKQNDGSGGSFYGKNPALATRELSIIANKGASRATFRVTSDDYRQPDNAPDSFETSAIKLFKENKKLTFTEAYEGNKYRYARPILVKKGCLKCHGDPADAPIAVIEKYGNLKAFHYKLGEVRGIVSVNLPAIGFKDVLQSLVNPFSIGFVLIALIINILFIHHIVIKRLVMLTKSAESIAAGKFETKLTYTNPKKSNDELDHLYHATDLLKRSMKIVFKKISAQNKTSTKP